MTRYTTSLAGRPLGVFETWHEGRDFLLKRGLATFLFGCILSIAPGVELKAIHYA